MKVKIIGGGLAGVEAAYFLAKNDIDVEMYEMRPVVYSQAHKTPNLAELVCSNSLRSNSITNAVGLLKEEMRNLGSIVMEAALNTSVPAGSSLAVDRVLFSKYIEDKLNKMKNIKIIREEVKSLDENDIVIISTGPLTSELFSDFLKEKLNSKYYHFFDAIAPIVDKNSIDFSKVYYKSRYDKGSADYLNCGFSEDEYKIFYNELIGATCSNLHEFDNQVFEGCLPVEVLAKRDYKSLTFGPLKPVGLDNNGKRYYAVVQLRKEDNYESMYNLVGFQTHLTFSEQKRVFSLIPGLENAKFLRYGVMHRNTYIDSPNLLNNRYQLKSNPNWYFAGQMTGVEGYVESAASGLISAIYLLQSLRNQSLITLSSNTIIGSMSRYISEQNKHFVPMNANFGLVPPIIERNKAVRLEMMSTRSLNEIKQFKESLDGYNF
jgi:methylenetetrahydrofolate--tRNA-(uracil-5-)-methyltransferase